MAHCPCPHRAKQLVLKVSLDLENNIVLCKEALSVVLAWTLMLFVCKQYDVTELHCTETPGHRANNRSSERTLQNKLGVSAARMQPTMIRLLNNQASSPRCNEHCLWCWSEHRQV